MGPPVSPHPGLGWTAVLTPCECSQVVFCLRPLKQGCAWEEQFYFFHHM